MSQQRLVVREVENRVLEVITPGPQGASGSAGGVTKINAGTNVSITPTDGLGEVTINSSGSGGSGTVTEVSSTSAVITVASGTTTPQITPANRGVAAGITPYPRSVTFNASGHVTGTVPGTEPAPKAGSTAIVTVGTIATGTWEGTTIGTAYGGTGATSAPMIGVVTAASAGAAQTVLGATAVGKAMFIASNAAAGRTAIGAGTGTLSNVVEDTSPQLGGNLDVQARTITTSTSNGNVVVDPPGSGFLQVEGTTNPGKIRLMCEAGTYGVGLISPPHSFSANYDLVLPPATGSVNQVIKTNGSGVLSFASIADAYTGQIETAAIKEYTLDPSVVTARTVTAVFIQSGNQSGSGGGTGTIILKKKENNTVSTIGSVSVSYSSGAPSSLSNTTIALNARLFLDCTANSSLTDVVFSVEYTS